MRSLVFLITTLVATSLYAQDMGGDAAMDAASDVGADASVDAGDSGMDMADAGTDTNPPADAGVDTGADMADDVTVPPDTDLPDVTVVADTGDDASRADAGADSALDMGPVTFTFSGVVTLAGASDSGAVSAQLTGPQYNSVTYTDAGGAFAFGGLDAGTYTLELTYPGYTTVRDTVALTVDTQRTYTLVAESTVPVTVAVSFSGAAAAVHISASRGLLNVDADIDATDGVAIWDAELPTGIWEADITASGYATHHVIIDATGEPREYLVTLSAPTAPGFEAATQCACSTLNTRGDLPWLMLPALLGFLVWRRRRA